MFPGNVQGTSADHRGISMNVVTDGQEATVIMQF